MSLQIITFLLTLVLSFSILMLMTRATASSKSAQVRLTSIRHSIQPHKSGTNGVDLETDGERNYAVRLGSFLQSYSFAKKLQVLLIHADSSMSVGGIVLACVGSALGCGLLSLLLLHMFLPACGATLVGAVIPYALLRRKRGRRLKAFNTALPDAIDLMARSLRAGHSMNSSIELIAEQSTEPLASEFIQVFKQQRLGLHFRDALLQMGIRIPSRDLQFLITAILVQKETGGDLTEILDRAAHVIRDRIRIEGEVRTHTAQGRLTGWILGLLPVILLALLNIVSPGYSSVLFHDPTGQKMLYAGGALIVLGGLVIRKIVDIQV
ncbi:MAG TPA: type II secretion system F family protein [Acidobacteriaceae bacterium]|jgi:tight adherence protein B|nr:type II secretion system F family protein [Acidobacteriaceae bacterium]